MVMLREFAAHHIQNTNNRKRMILPDKKMQKRALQFSTW